MILVFEGLTAHEQYVCLNKDVFAKYASVLPSSNSVALCNADVERNDTEKYEAMELAVVMVATNPWHKVPRIWNANYWCATLCQRAFGLTPPEVVSRLSGKVAEVREHLSGVLLIYSYKELTSNAVAAIDDELRPYLRK